MDTEKNISADHLYRLIRRTRGQEREQCLRAIGLVYGSAMAGMVQDFFDKKRRHS
ncbi:MAG TPA: hypothetical protein P5346_05050 [Spirochaetota bacterium]|nr:hypothetical protein [Spirochaetota bacterium]HSA14093.1 hypothetical protein [Spirochaetota bacterium]